MPNWDLATLDNWQLILQDSRVAQRVTNAPLAPGDYRYKPIPPIFATPSVNTLLVGTFSQTAKPYWFLGARASQYLYVSPSMSSNFISGVQAGNTINVGLNRLTLIEFKDYNISPYVLHLEIPYWIEDIYVEVWEFTGYMQPDYQDILDRLDSIETKIDSTHTP